MSRPKLLLPVLLLIVATPPLWSQSIETDGDIEIGGQLVSKVPTGTPPLRVSSTTKVASLNADLLDGYSESHFFSLEDLLPVIAYLDNPDPPCFDTSHRFVNCGNGTVTDTATGLIWLEDADCFEKQDYPSANATAAALWDGATGHPGGGDCGLADGSRPGDWRLATAEEWRTLFNQDCEEEPRIMGNGTTDTGCYSDHSWAGDLQGAYWTMESVVTIPNKARKVVTTTAFITIAFKNTDSYGWPVRGPSRGGE